jgi:hypothetical protein
VNAGLDESLCQNHHPTMQPIRPIVLALVCVTNFFTSQEAMSEVRKPNVVIFLTDDQGTLDANCYGSKDLYTPAMDKLAETGVSDSVY